MRLLRKIVARVWDKALVAAGVAYVLLPTSPLNMPFADRDSGVFLYIGWRILNGELPYRDIWDHKPPIIHYLNALGLVIGNGSRWGVWAIEFVALFSAAFIGFRLLRKALGTGPASLSLLVWLTTLVFALQGGNLTTEYTLPLQFALLWLANSIGRSTASTYGRWFLIGVITAVAFFTKQTTVGIGIAIILYFTIQRMRSGQARRWLRELALLLAGFSVIVVGVLAFFQLQGALGYFWSATFEYNAAYSLPSGDTLASRIRPFISGIVPLTKTGLLQISAIGYVIGFALLFKGRTVVLGWTPLLAIGLIDLPIEMALAGISGEVHPHYYMALLPILAVFAGITFWVLLSQLASWGISRATRAASVATMMAALLWTSAALYRMEVVSLRDVGNRVPIEYIKATTAPDDHVLLWGAEAGTNFFAERRSPTRFVYQYPLYTPGYTDAGLVEEFLDDILIRRPRLIIDTRDPMTPMYDFPAQSPTTQSQITLLQSLYRAAGQLDGWTVYERRAP